MNLIEHVRSTIIALVGSRNGLETDAEPGATISSF
jgi:hypothetical protein